MESGGWEVVTAGLEGSVTMRMLFLFIYLFSPNMLHSAFTYKLCPKFTEKISYLSAFSVDDVNSGWDNEQLGEKKQIHIK